VDEYTRDCRLAKDDVLARDSGQRQHNDLSPQ
jgi:hypothetical protein